MRGKWLLCLVLCGCFGLAALAQDTTSESPALQQLVTAYEEAVRSGDISKTGLRRSLTDGFSATLPSGQLITSYSELTRAENALRTMVGRGAVYGTIAVSVDPKIEVSGDLAAFSGRTENRATAQGGKSRAFTTHWSAVAKKEDGQWKLARHQSVMDPANNPWNGEEASSGPGWVMVFTVGLLCSLAGLIVGFIASKILGGRGAAPPVPPTPRPAAPAAKTRAWDAAPPASHTESADSNSASSSESRHQPEAFPPPSDSSRKRAWEK